MWSTYYQEYVLNQVLTIRVSYVHEVYTGTECGVLTIRSTY